MNEKEAIKLLKKYSPDEKSFDNVLKHSQKVMEVALKFTKNKECDIEFIKIACLLHDIGRFKTKDVIKHGIIGGKILREEGLSEKYALVCERHLGAGINKTDIKEQKLTLPMKDYIPKTIEEKIITMADNLVFNNKEVSIDQVYERYKKEISEKVAKRVLKLYNEVISP